MPFFERIIGFSTGAVAKADFRSALSALKRKRVPAVELSALREEELPELSSALKQLDLSGFSYVSVHAPTRFLRLEEKTVVDLLSPAAALGLPIVVHPDTIHSKELWKQFGNLILIENMDKRKRIGRTCEEVRGVLEKLPEARVCFDVAHVRQVDPTMIEAAQMAAEFGEKIHEIHASGVSTRSAHGPISAAASFAYSSIAHLIPETAPIILESPIDEELFDEEIDFAKAAFSPWLNRLRDGIDSALNQRSSALKRQQVENFLSTLRLTHSRLCDFEAVVLNLQESQAIGAGGTILSARDLLNKLSENQRAQLEAYLIERIKILTREFPDLRNEFAEQFSGVD